MQLSSVGLLLDVTTLDGLSGHAPIPHLLRRTEFASIIPVDVQGHDVFSPRTSKPGGEGGLCWKKRSHY